ncbi:MAG: flagellin FliC [Bdellovibrionales bacterium CG10_big_fil_rev_8_21_14_0_10_45_34]|nr:MAG: flagellin FliC [Bdellovibrionales bacterium CG10_big_fil_rev_8_21_14_0_10_45_34]
MGLRVSTNVSSINAQRNLAASQVAVQKSFAQLASGSRITKAADDAAGLAISENMNAQIRGLRQADRNANDAISLVQVAEGGLVEVSNILTRLRELGIQAASDNISNTERGFLDLEVQQLKDEMQRISESTRFGGQNLLDGTGGEFGFQVNINNNDFQDRIYFDAAQINATNDNLGVSDLSFISKEGARDALSTIDAAQSQVNGHRATLGSVQSRLMSTSSNLNVAVENLSAANSRIRDTDIAASSAEVAKNNILLNASTSVLAQANQFPQVALKLVG